MYKKKISTIAIITILTLSILLAAIPMASAAITVGPDLSVATGSVGTPVTVSGIDGGAGDAAPFSTVNIYWEDLSGQLLGTVGADSIGEWSKKVTIPSATAGDHFIVADDGGGAQGTLFTVTSEIKLSTTKGLPGDLVTVTGTGFGEEVDVGIGLGAEVGVTGEAVGTGDGSTKAFPLDYSPVKPASATISAPGIGDTTWTTGGLVTTPTTITVTAPSITADFIAGLYDDATGLVELVAPVASTGDDSTADTVVLTYTYAASTAYRVKITATDETGVYTLADNGDLTGAGADITITTYTYTITTEYTINYATGVITFVTAPVLGETISADYTRYTYDVTPVTGVETSDVGSFSAVILIPAIAEIDYAAFTVTAIDTDANTDTATLTVDYYVTVTPTSGPTGITITIAGRIEATTDYDLYFNAAHIAPGTSDGDGVFSGTYGIPAVLSVATYPVDVVWEVTKKKTVNFDVTAPPQVVYAPTSGVAGAVIKISTVAGFPFSANANITAYLGTTVVNSTATDDRFGPTGFMSGAFTDLEFTVPTLTPGPYALKVVDEYGASTAAIYTFTVLPTPVVTVALRGTTYYPCCTLSFNIVTTETGLGTITVTIRDPSGAIWWTTVAWSLSGTVTKSVYYQDQLVIGNPIKLPLDAPLGSWNWTVTYTPVSTGILTKATGLFTVAAEPGMQDVLDQLDTMEASIKSVVTTSEGKIIVAVNTKAGEIIIDLDALGAKLQGLEDLGVVIATDVDDIQIDLAALDLTVLDALGVDITAIKGDVATITSNIGTVTTAVSALDAKVTSLSGDVATVSTTLGTLQGTVTSIDGDIATIDTEVGTLQADIADIDLDVDMTPAWIAVVLSLVAAIAAVFAVITIRQKIAG